MASLNFNNVVSKPVNKVRWQKNSPDSHTPPFKYISVVATNTVSIMSHTKTSNDFTSLLQRQWFADCYNAALLTTHSAFCDTSVSEKLEIAFLSGIKIRFFSFGCSCKCGPRTESHRSRSQKPLTLFTSALTGDSVPWDSFATASIAMDLPDCSLLLYGPLLWRRKRSFKGVVRENVTSKRTIWQERSSKIQIRKLQSSSSSSMHLVLL